MTPANTKPLPTLFLSHGSPLHALDAGAAGEAWSGLATALPRPRAVLIVSAHWETSIPMLTGGERPETIHDFSGFPAPLYQLRYAASGAPAVAEQASSLLRDAGFPAAVNSCRGLDHGAWVPLRWMYPQADVPVLQLSVQTELGTAYHYGLGQALQPLTRSGVLIIGSGHVTHNLADWSKQRGTARPLAYAAQFAAWLEQNLRSGDRNALFGYREQAPSAERAHPTEEHFLPLLVAWGAAGTHARVSRVHHGFEGAALSMDAYRFDA
jgi:4,5-DOPA dioxygenase extradiol